MARRRARPPAGRRAGRLPPGPFDLITLWHALEHDYVPLETLRRLRSVVRPGGAIVVEVPNYDSLTRRLQGERWAGFHTPRHTAVYTPATLRSDAGARRMAGHATVPARHPRSLRALVARPPGAAGRPLDGSLERAFPGFMLGKVVTLPVALAQRWLSLGVQVAIARAE